MTLLDLKSLNESIKTRLKNFEKSKILTRRLFKAQDYSKANFKVSEYYPHAIKILYLYHVSEYVWAAAHQIYPQNTKLRKVWVKRRLQSLEECTGQNMEATV